MPIRKLDSSAFAVSDFTVNMDNRGKHFIYLSCAYAESYVFCFSKKGEIFAEDLSLTEKDIESLCAGGSMEFDTKDKGRVRLKGVRKIVFDSTTRFNDFTVNPPERIQVWTISKNNIGTCDLYIPEVIGKETAYVPAHFSYTLEKRNSPKGNQIVELTISIGEGTDYVDGAIEYKFGDFKSIPLPLSYINKRFTVKDFGLPLKVAPAKGFEDMYVKR